MDDSGRMRFLSLCAEFSSFRPDAAVTHLFMCHIYSDQKWGEGGYVGVAKQ